eukprot:GGOE01061205.1.p1 GENE.GGOE01061205.1~~GGOE01061205.1.p1  ORF type:complete len:250 (-),score=44.55 GGOE01061205.1:206-898(-)
MPAVWGQFPQGGVLSAVASGTLGLLLVWLLRPTGRSAELHAAPAAAAATRPLFRMTPFAPPAVVPAALSAGGVDVVQGHKHNHDMEDAAVAPESGMAAPSPAQTTRSWALTPWLTLGALVGWYSSRGAAGWATVATAGESTPVMLKPLNGHVVVEELAQENATGGGLLLMDQAKWANARSGRVVATGADTDPQIVVGAKVLFQKTQGEEFTLEGISYVAVPESCLLGVIE